MRSSSVKVHGNFEATYRLHLQGSLVKQVRIVPKDEDDLFPQNFDGFIPNYRASNPSRAQASY